jgi:hypothetical protein
MDSEIHKILVKTPFNSYTFLKVENGAVVPSQERQQVRASLSGRLWTWINPKASHNLDNVISHLFRSVIPSGHLDDLSLEQLENLKHNLLWAKDKASKHVSSLTKFFQSFLPSFLRPKGTASMLDEQLSEVEEKINERKEIRKLNVLLDELNSAMKVFDYQQDETALFRGTTLTKEGAAQLSAEFDQSLESGRSSQMIPINHSSARLRDLVYLLQRRISALPGKENLFRQWEGLAHDPNQLSQAIHSLSVEDKVFVEGYIRLLRQAWIQDWMPRFQDPDSSLNHFYRVATLFTPQSLHINQFLPLFKQLMTNQSIISN